MITFSTTAMMLRRVDFGDYDLILTLFTLDRGKISVIAKSAKKSKKRFPGILELFSVSEVVCSRGRGLPVLQEASLKQPFIRIRSDIRKTAYASYWAELTNVWSEPDESQPLLFHLLCYVLGELDSGNVPEVLSILFQMRFMILSGFFPNLSHCGLCGIETEGMKNNRVIFDLARGELLCEKCVSVRDFGSVALPFRVFLSKGTIRQLLWVGNGDLEKAGRVRFSPLALREGLAFLEAFVLFHLGMMPRSLGFLRQLRSAL